MNTPKPCPHALTKPFLHCTVMAACSLLWTQAVLARVVTIDPGFYLGSWSIGGSEWHQGKESLDLAGGTYAVYVGLVGSFDLTVADDGTMGVTSPAATIPDGSTLLLNNCSVLIDPAAYEGHWTVTRYTNPEWLSGSAPLVLVPGLDYELNIAWSGHIRFGLDEHGVPNTLATDSFEIKTEPATIRFKTYPITVDVDQYAGNWGIYQVQDRQPGSRTLALVPGLDYVFEIAWPSEARLRPLTWTATGRLVASSNPQLPRLAHRILEKPEDQKTSHVRNLT